MANVCPNLQSSFIIRQLDDQLLVQVHLYTRVNAQLIHKVCYIACSIDKNPFLGSVV